MLTYQLPTFTGLTTHSENILLFRDGLISDKERLEIDVEVRSGDYFVTLATKLDLLSQNVTNRYIRASLDKIVTDLVYMQHSYTINKDSKDEQAE
jgi:hypothetical protein